MVENIANPSIYSQRAPSPTRATLLQIQCSQPASHWMGMERLTSSTTAAAAVGWPLAGCNLGQEAH